MVLQVLMVLLVQGVLDHQEDLVFLRDLNFLGYGLDLLVQASPVVQVVHLVL